MYAKRFYRRENPRNKSAAEAFEVEYFESSLFVRAPRALKQKARSWLVYYHDQISGYIRAHPRFGHSLAPLPFDAAAPAVIKDMYKASQKAGVGPMAAVAGAIAERVGRKLLRFCGEVLVENGGDIFASVKTKKIVGIFSGISGGDNRLCLTILPEDTPCGICTSSGTVGHSLSFGKSAATVVIARSAAAADAFATAVGNMVHDHADIPGALAYAKKHRLIKGLLIITGKKTAACGAVRFTVLAPAQRKKIIS